MALSSASRGDRSSGPLDKPPFTATPDELRAVADAAPAGDWPAVILREDRDISYDEKGSATLRWRLVYLITSDVGVDGWGTARTSWRPWFQDRPVLRARVIDPAGNVSELDAAQLRETPVMDDAGKVISERRRLEARLPGIKVGAIVEEQSVIVGREPLSQAGEVDKIILGDSVPTVSSAFSFSAPVSRKLRVVVRRLPASARTHHEVAAGRETWSYEVGALPALSDPEDDVPGDVVTVPYIGATTGEGWGDVARSYRVLVDQRIAEGPVTWPAEIPRATTLDTVAALTRWLHARIRYTGIDFGDAALVPSRPAEIVSRGSADCKDSTTLLVALLRMAGVSANVVLIHGGLGNDVDPELPGFGSFTHAVVLARISGRDLWIDATQALSRPGQLPAFAQGRRGLVVADDTRGLTITPRSEAKDSVILQVRSFVVGEQGPSQLTEVTRPSGGLETHLRGFFRDTPAAELKQRYARYADSEYGGTLTRVAASDPSDLVTLFEPVAQIAHAERVFAAPDHIVAAARPCDGGQRACQRGGRLDRRCAREAPQRLRRIVRAVLGRRVRRAPTRSGQARRSAGSPAPGVARRSRPGCETQAQRRQRPERRSCAGPSSGQGTSNVGRHQHARSCRGAEWRARQGRHRPLEVFDAAQRRRPRGQRLVRGGPDR
jgi:hypothetical protein